MFISTYYILRQLFLATFVITFLLTGTIWLAQSLQFIDMIINKGLSIISFFHLMIFTLPDLINIIIPIALFISILFTYNKLITDKELIILRSSGMSDLQISKPCLILSIITTIFLYGINIYITPISFRHFKNMEYDIRNQATKMLLQENIINSFDNITIYTKEQKRNGELIGLFIYDNRQVDHPVTLTAQKGFIKQTKKQTNLILLNGTHQTIEKKTGKPNILYFERYFLDLSPTKVNYSSRPKKPYEFFTKDLLFPKNSDPKTALKLKAEGHKRLITPLYTIIFSLIALIAILKCTSNKQKKLFIFFAVILCIIDQILTLGLINLSDRIFMAIPITYVLNLTLSLIMFYLLLFSDFKNGLKN